MHSSKPKSGCRRGARRVPRIEPLEGRCLLTAIPLGASPLDTGEYLLGSVAVTPVLFESNGQTDASSENWDAAEIARILNNVRSGLDWWVDALATFDTPHSLEFVLDDAFALDPVETPFEPISRQSDAYTDYVGQFFADQGYLSQSSWGLEEAARAFNHDQRQKLGTDWAFTIFVVDAEDDSDGQFAPGGTFRQAFAFAGGLFMVIPSTRPASTYAHESGHIFWARDEYHGGGSYADRRGYYDTQNWNAADNPDPDFVQQPSIMSSGLLLQQAWVNHTSAASTLAMVGWQDSDGDGIFDVLDVPLDLDVSAAYREGSGTLRVVGSATAVALPNQNSAGLGNDITLNRISRIEYRVDKGPWQTAAAPDAQQAAIDLVIPVDSGFAVIDLRAVDAATGIASNIVSVPRTRPTAGDVAIDGFVYVDYDENDSFDGDDALLSNARMTLLDPIPFLHGRLDPDDLDGVIAADQGNLTIEAIGNTLDGRVGAFEGGAANGTASFHYFDAWTGDWGNAWSSRHSRRLQIALDAPTSDASIAVVGSADNSYARLEAYDADGVLLVRDTVGPLGSGEAAMLAVHHAGGRIHSVRAFGHAGTSVSLDDFRYGPATAITSSAVGAFGFPALPDGTYTVHVESPASRYEIADPLRTVTVAGGVATPLSIAAVPIVSRWMNPANPLDVNNDGIVQPLDALRVINDLNRSTARALTDADPIPPYLDANGDGSVTPLDALRVINYLNRNPAGALPAGAAAGEPAGRTATASPVGQLASAAVDAFFGAGLLSLAEGEPESADPAATTATPPAAPVLTTPAVTRRAGGAATVGPELGERGEWSEGTEMEEGNDDADFAELSLFTGPNDFFRNL